jgi:transcriptional regulator with XRE-family HTH domain
MLDGLNVSGYSLIGKRRLTVVDGDAPAPPGENLGMYLRSARLKKELSLRAVEEATEGEVSNAYLSQLENGKIAKPSPHVLYALANALDVSYETLMERAGYIVKAGERAEGSKHGKAATFSIDNLTPEEERALLEHLNYLRWQRNRK